MRFSTNFIEKDGEPCEVVCKKEMDLILHEVDIQQIEAKQQEAYRLVIYTKNWSYRIPLRQGPTIPNHFNLQARNAPGYIWISHHIIMDEMELTTIFPKRFFLSMKSFWAGSDFSYQPLYDNIDYVCMAKATACYWRHGSTKNNIGRNITRCAKSLDFNHCDQSSS